jgi:peptide/nickel transport system substrate-binding protein
MRLLQRGTRRIIIGALITVVVAGCAQPAPPSATTAPPKPAAAAKPAEAPKPAAAAPAKPAEAAKPAAAGPTQAKGQLIVAVEGEPENGLMPKMACSLITDFTSRNIYESLTAIDNDGKIVGVLAESWQQTGPTTWRFKLRQGVKFHNGEPFNADAVVATVDHELNPQNTPGRCNGDYSTLAFPATKVDEYTVDLTTSAPDPILPNKLIKFKIAPTQWLKSTSEDQMGITAIGTGPYSLAEWQRGSQILLKANPDYWGSHKPSIAEVKIIPRKEASVRASMVQAGEAHLAFSIPPEQAKQMPKSVVEKTTEMVGIRLNTEHPTLKDIRVRQAIAYSIDTNALMEAFYPGFATPANGQMVRQASFGSNPNLKPYPVDPAKAKQLVQEAGAVGAPLELIIREANFAKITELGEAITNSVSAATGLKMTPRNMEASQWRESLFAVKPGEKRSDTFMTAASNPTFDSSRVLDAYYGCKGRFSHFCDEAFTQKMDQASAASGEERRKLYQELWQTAYDNYWVLPLLGLDYVHGSSAKVVWTPRIDNNWLFVEMQLQD